MIKNRMPTIREHDSETGSTQKMISSHNWESRVTEHHESFPGIKNHQPNDSLYAKRFSRETADFEGSADSRNNTFGFQDPSGTKKDDNRWRETPVTSLSPLRKETADQPQAFKTFYAKEMPFRTSKPLKPSVPDRQHLQIKNFRPTIRNQNSIFDFARRDGKEPDNVSKDIQSTANNPKFGSKKQGLGEYRVLNLSEVKKRLESNQKAQANVTNAPVQEDLKLQRIPTFNPQINDSNQDQLHNNTNKAPQNVQSENIKITEGQF